MDLKLLMPILIIQLILILIAIIDLVKREKSEIKGENKILWGVIILLISFIGPIIYFTVGKKR